MKNAHERFGELRFRKMTRETTLDVRVWLDRLIAEPASESGSRGKAHLLSVFGGDQDIAAVSAAIAEQATFEVNGPGIPRLCVSLGDNSDVFRGSLNIPRRKRPVRNLVAVSNELALTRHGGDMNARRTVLASDDPEFMLYRIGIRFGLPVLPEWSEWFAEELARRRALRMLVGLGCRPVLVTGTKKRFLGWIGHALKRKRISIPDNDQVAQWEVPAKFGGLLADRAQRRDCPPRRTR
jgi:hypothetical protein